MQSRGIDMPEVAPGGSITVSFCRPIGNKGKLLLYTCCILYGCRSIYGGKLFLVHLCGEVDFSRSPRPHDDVTLTDLITALDSTL